VAGDDLVFTLGPARVDGGAWKSAGDCALARKWTKSVVGASTGDASHASR
jgi:hypothetical protein